MPNIKSAKKKMRKDVKREKNNAFYIRAIEKAFKLISRMKAGDASSENLKKAVSVIDKAAKRKVIHKNKAARLKSRVTKLASKKK